MPNHGNEPPEQKRQRQASEVHAALGRYVEAFEQTVMWIRTGCVLLSSIMAQTTKTVQQQTLMNIVFNHRSMTADNLLRIYRSMVAEIANDKDTGIPEKERAAIDGVLRQFDKEFQEAVSKRNDYLHGTWFIGLRNEAAEDWSAIGFSRAKATNEGLKFVEGPKSAADIDALTKESERLADFLLRFHGCFLADLTHQTKSATNVSENFILEKKRWAVKQSGTRAAR
jgi:hypothetical protein